MGRNQRKPLFLHADRIPALDRKKRGIPQHAARRPFASLGSPLSKPSLLPDYPAPPYHAHHQFSSRVVRACLKYVPPGLPASEYGRP